MKEVWIRLGVTLKLTDEEAQRIFDEESMKDVIKETVAEDRFILDGESYIPEACVDDFNQKYSTVIPVQDYGCDIYEH